MNKHSKKHILPWKGAMLMLRQYYYFITRRKFMP